MKHLPWDQRHVRWDAYHAFHMGIGPYGPHATDPYNPATFVQFDTGEMIATRQVFDHNKRGHYGDANITLHATTDDSFPAVALPDGTPAPKAWLNDRGLQTVVEDHDLKRIYRVACDNDYLAPRLPERFVTRVTKDGTSRAVSTDAYIYWPGGGREPVACPVNVSIPAQKVLTPEEWARIKDLKAMMAAILGLTDDGPRYRIPSGTVDAYSLLNLSNDEVASFPKEDMRRFVHGTGLARVGRQVPYLTVLP